jgi:hypothetical protein
MQNTNNIWPDVVKSLWITKQSHDLEKMGISSSASLNTRFKDFPYIVKINKSWQEWLNIHADAEFWCEENCSDVFATQWLEGYRINGDFIVDLNVRTVEDFDKFEQAFFFGFKNEADAIMFTLRWSGNG